MGNKNEFMKEIIDYISTIVDFCIADGNTYLYAKCVPTVREDNKKLPIGGGNFTVLLSTLATLEFLATIDAILKAKEEDFYSKEEIKEIEQKKDKFDDELLKNLFLTPKTGRLKKGSGKIIREFIENTANLTGINKKDAGKIQTIRNKLAHEFTPKIRAALGVDFCPGSDFVSMALLHDERDVFCLSSEGSIGIDSNALNRKLKKLSKYVIEKLDTIPEKAEAVNRINRYIRETK